MKAFWHLHQPRLDPDLCRFIIKEAMRVTPQPGLVGLDAHVNPDYRGCTCRWLHEDAVDPDDRGLTWSDTFRLLKRAMDLANLNYFGVDCAFIRHIQFTTYRAVEAKQEIIAADPEIAGTEVALADDHFSEHQDTFLVDPRYASHRKLSVTVQLSDPADYEGGDFKFHQELPQPDRSALRQQGTLLVFPSILRHRVEPVTRGTRHVLVAWYEGPKWR